MTDGEWKQIPGFPDYEASSLGQIRSLKAWKPRVLVGGYNDKGYRQVGLHYPGIAIRRTVHRLVALTFLGETPEGLQVRHIDGDKNNCAVSNLTFGTASDNILDQVRHGHHYYANRTECPQRHPYSPDNTYVIPSTGGRMCRTCMRERYQRSAFRAAGIAA